MTAIKVLQKFGFFCLVLFGCSTSKSWTIEEYEDDDWAVEVFKERVLSVLDDPKTEFCLDRNCIPKEVKQAYAQFFGFKFSIANPGKPFNCSCARDKRPDMRLLCFAKRGPECVFISKRGGRACNCNVVYFKMEGGKLRQMHGLGGFNLKKEDLETLRDCLENVEHRSRRVVGDWRSAGI